MPLVVEDGTGIANANSYISIADADTYFNDRGNETWPDLDSDVKVSALIRATDYLTRTYYGKWAGTKYLLGQSLDWPRAYVRTQSDYEYANLYYYGFYPLSPLPKLLLSATAELAYKVSQGIDLDPDLSQGITRETIGPITVEYDKNSRRLPTFSAIEKILAPLLKPVSLNFCISRG